MYRGDHFQFGLVFIKKKSNQTEFFFLKTETEPKPVQTDRFWFGYFRIKTGFFLVWLGFFQFFSGWIQFGFFDFRLIKLKSNRTGWFFLNFNRFNQFFFTVWFFQLQTYKTETEPNRFVFKKF